MANPDTKNGQPRPEEKEGPTQQEAPTPNLKRRCEGHVENQKEERKMIIFNFSNFKFKIQKFWKPLAPQTPTWKHNICSKHSHPLLFGRVPALPFLYSLVGPGPPLPFGAGPGLPLLPFGSGSAFASKEGIRFLNPILSIIPGLPNKPWKSSSHPSHPTLPPPPAHPSLCIQYLCESPGKRHANQRRPKEVLTCPPQCDRH